MKQKFFTALVFGLLFTSCAPRAAMSLDVATRHEKTTEIPPTVVVQHHVEKTDGTVPETRIVNLSSGESAEVTVKRHYSEIAKGQVVQYEVSKPGYISKVYTVDTRGLQNFEILIVQVKALSPGEGVDSLSTIFMGDEPRPSHFNNQPLMPIVFLHPGNSLGGHQ